MSPEIEAKLHAWPSVSSDSFASINYMDAILYVPQGSLEAYQNANVWKDFWDILNIFIAAFKRNRFDNQRLFFQILNVCFWSPSEDGLWIHIVA